MEHRETAHLSRKNHLFGAGRLRLSSLEVDALGMKSFLIMVLMTALVAAACYTRPGRRELVFFLLESQSQAESWSKREVEKAQKFARNVTIRDRWLWVDAEVEGEIVYTGAFAHWFPRTQKGESADKSETTAVMEVARLLGNGKF